MGAGVLQQESSVRQQHDCCLGCHADTSQVQSLLWGPEHSLEFCLDCSDELPFCHTCNAPAEHLADTGERTLCCRCFHPLALCYVCGDEGFRSLSLYEDLCFCEGCSGQVCLGTCCQCGRSDVLDEDFYCPTCKDTGVSDDKRARELAHEVILFMEESLKMVVSKKIEFRLVQRLTSKEGVTYFGMFYSGLDKIAVVSGLPEPLFLSVFAHEWAHAWQSEHCPEQEMDLIEGFASWVEFKILYELYQDFAKSRLKESTLKHYGPGLRACLRVEEQLGEQGLIDAVKVWTGFPLGV